MKNVALYNELLADGFDDGYSPDMGYRFVDKLMKNNDWTEELAYRAILEYKKFIYLIITYGSVAPSDIVDQVWHQHILYTRDYSKFCYRFAARFINHSPDRNVGVSSTLYNDMLVNYKAEFGKPPHDIWDLQPSDYKRVDLSTSYLVPANNLGSAIRLLFLVIHNKISSIF